MRLLWTVPLALSTCSTTTNHSPNPHDEPCNEMVGGQLAISVERELDLLVVVDNSYGMVEEQERLASQFEALLWRFVKEFAWLPDLHVGVVSTDLGAGTYPFSGCDALDGDRGCLLRGSCLGPGESFIVVENTLEGLSGNVVDLSGPVDGSCPLPGEAQPNGELDVCDVAAAFSCMVHLGSGGCGIAQPLESMARALSSPNIARQGCNEGFLREGSFLAILVLTDKDDCSLSADDLFSAEDSDLGPLSSFRCFEFGTTCDQAITREPQELTGCHPDEAKPWLHAPAYYAEFLGNLRTPERLLFSAIAGPWSVGDVVRVEVNSAGSPMVTPSCEQPGDGRPGLRLRAVADELGSGGVYAADVGAASCSDEYLPAAMSDLDRHGDIYLGCFEATPSAGCGGPAIQSWEQAECEVKFSNNESIPRCRFSGEGPVQCPYSAPPGPPGAVEEAPCWYLCEAKDLPDGREPCWSPRLCFDSYCQARDSPVSIEASFACTAVAGTDE